MNHYLKIDPIFFKAVKDGIKPFELRKDDRGFNIGDILVLQEYAYGEYTGRELERIVSFILRGSPWLTDGYCALGLLEDKNGGVKMCFNEYEELIVLENSVEVKNFINTGHGNSQVRLTQQNLKDLFDGVTLGFNDGEYTCTIILE